MQALHKRQWGCALRLLRRLTDTLPPQDAAAACVCAFQAPDRVIHAILDHSPPIREFQCAGVGKITSLMNIAAQYNQHRLLRILLDRGADPNLGDGICTPLESAFIYNSHLALLQLLAEPDLKVELTEPMLEAWGHYSLCDKVKRGALLRRWCCQALWERLHPGSTDCVDSSFVPLPAELRPRHALQHNNHTLAARICETNPLNAEDLEDLKVHLTFYSPNPLYRNSQAHKKYIWAPHQLLLRVLIHQLPDPFADPVLRSIVVWAVIISPEPDAELLSAVSRLPAGMIHLLGDQISLLYPQELGSFLRSDSISMLNERIGKDIILAMDRNAITEHLARHIRAYFRDLAFTGSIPAEHWDKLLPIIFREVPVNETHELFRPNGLLENTPSRMLLSLLPHLKPEQRAIVVQHCHSDDNFVL